MTEYHLSTPLKNSCIESIKIGDLVYLSGEAFTCRSRLQRYIFDESGVLPFSTSERNILIHVGPIVIKEDLNWKLVSFMPTSSIRFEKWGWKSIDKWNLKVICGKTTMGERTMKMMKEKKCIHISPSSVSPNLWVDSIKIKDVFLLDRLGSIEASWILQLDELGPFIVDIDSHGNNLYEKINHNVNEKINNVYDQLNISSDFDYTKLFF